MFFSACNFTSAKNYIDDEGNAYAVVDGIGLIGDPPFINQVEECLVNIKINSASDFKYIKKFIKQIALSQHPLFEPWKYGHSVELEKSSVFFSKTWCAASIYILAYRMEMYDEFARNNRLPDKQLMENEEIWLGIKATHHARENAKPMLKRLNISAYELSVLESQWLNLALQEQQKNRKFVDFFEADVSGIKVLGKSTFIDSVTSCIYRLEDYAPEAFELLKSYGSVIFESTSSNPAYYEVPQKINFNIEIKQRGIFWCSASLAYNAYINRLFSESYTDEFRYTFDKNLYDQNTGEQATKRATKYMAEVFRQIGGDRETYDYLLYKAGIADK